MNTLRNNVQLIGHIGIDPELKKTNTDKTYVSIPMATTERYHRDGEWKSDTQWHRLVLWENAAERAVKNLKKGSFIAVEGKIRYHTYVDGQGVTRHSTDIRVFHYMILSKRELYLDDPDIVTYADPTESETEASESQAMLRNPEHEDELPF